MPTYLSPGVYVEEIDSGSRPIEGVGTAVAAFVGLSEKGPFNQPTLVSNWTQFTKTFGGFVDGACLAESVFAYFQNGGGNSYVVRIGDTGSENGSGSTQQAIGSAPQGMLANLRVVALDPGAPPDSIKVEIGKADDRSRIVMKKPEVVDAVKGQGYREVDSKLNRRKPRTK